MDTTRHRGKVAIITGAGSGIGAATAVRMAAEGATVVGVDVNAEGLEKVRAQIEEAGGEVTIVTADITDQEAVDRVVQTTLERYGRIDVLANIAGIMDWFLPAHELDDETWRRVMAVNVNGPMLLMRATLPVMMRQKAGAIVNVGSVGGLRGAAAGFAYTTSKHALVGMTKSVAWAYREEGIRANLVAPGGVETGIGSTSVPRSEWGMAQLGPIHATATRMAQPDEIATLVSWLASDEASNVNGAVVTADGGWTAG
ncbi:MAG TPA: SDR family NAD(P)-dependent oxidoreductase [Egibacteraceae bacterium]